MYCGDETAAFVGDCGFSTCRFGYGGEDSPKQVLPSYTSSDYSHIPSPNTAPSHDTIPIFTQPSNPLTTSSSSFLDTPTGLISDFAGYELAWEKAFSTLRVRDAHKQNLSMDIKCPHPILAIDSGHVSLDSKKQREKMVEFFFEKMDAPAVFLAPSSTLQSFSMGRQTGLVFDMGAAGCRSTPLVDGLVINNAQRRNGLGGSWLENIQLELLKKMGIKEVKPRYELKRTWNGEKKKGFHQFALSELMYEMKTGWHVRVSPFDSEMDEGVEDEDTEKTIHQLPDGTKINLNKTQAGKDLCFLPDLLFSDHPLKDVNIPEPSIRPGILANSFPHTLVTESIQKMIHSSLTAVDPDLRKELCGNILLCGSHSLFPGMEQRLSKEMSELIPSSYKVRVVAPKSSVERKFAGWIGGSVLTSLGSFQQLWLSRVEYEEYGVSLGCERFP